MRWAFLSLLLVNAMFFAWRYFAPPGEFAGAPVNAVESASPPPSDLAAQTITLLDEVANNEIKLKTEQPNVVSIKEGAPSKAVAVKESEVAQVNSVVPDETVQTSRADFRAQAVPDDDACYWAGPFTQQADRAELIKRLAELHIFAEERTQVASGGWRYWVYLPPKPSRKEAKAQLAVLKNMKVDSYLIYEGEKANGVSLGLFSRKELADAKYADIQSRGFEVTMDSFERTVNQRWVAVSKAQIDAIGEAVLPRMIKNKTGVQVIEKKCELPVASHNNIH